MPLQKRQLPAGGLTNLVTMPNFRDPTLADVDKAYFHPDGSIGPAPGWNRVWAPKTFNDNYDGAANQYLPNGGDCISVMVESQLYERQNAGAILVAADRGSSAVLGMAQFVGGISGSSWVGAPSAYTLSGGHNDLTTRQQAGLAAGNYLTQIVGLGPNLGTIIAAESTTPTAITVSGSYTGRQNGAFYIFISDNVSNPNKFKWVLAETMPLVSDPSWTEDDVDTSPVLMSFGVSVQWASLTGNSGIWKLPVAFSDVYKVSADNGFNWLPATETSPNNYVFVGDTFTIDRFGNTAALPYLHWGHQTGHGMGSKWRWRIGGLPTLACNLNRVTARDVVNFCANSEGMVFGTGFDRLHIHTGQTNTVSGILPPQIKPVSVGLINENETIDLGNVETSTWTSWAGTGVVTTADTVVFARGTQSQRMVIPRSLRRGNSNLAYRDLSSPVALTSANKRIRFFLRVDTRRGNINKRIFNLVLASAATLGGTVVEIPINVKIRRNAWLEVDVPWEGGTLTVASVGLKLKGSLETEMFTTDTRTVTAYIDEIYTDNPAYVIPASTTFTTSTWQFKFSWLDSGSGRLSAPSPSSGDISVNSTGIRIDCSGTYAQMPDGLRNTCPPNADSVVIYASSADFNQDPRIGGSTFYRLSPPGGHKISDLYLNPINGPALDGGANAGACSFYGLTATDAMPVEVWTLQCTANVSKGTEVFSVRGSVSGSQGNAIADGTTVFTYNGLSFAFLSNGSAKYEVGDLIIFNTGPIVSFTDEINVDSLADPNNQLDPFFNELLPGGKYLVADADRIISLGQPDFSIGTAAFTNGTNQCTISGAYLGDWVQGRFIVPKGQNTRYRINKVLSTSGTTSVLQIGRESAVTSEFTDPYDGATFTGGGYVILGDMTSMRWSNKTDEFGIDPQTSSPFNNLAMMTGGDVITGGGKSGPYLWVFGLHNSANVQQNPGALDDNPAAGLAYTNPYFVQNVGCVSGDAIVSMPDESLIVLGDRGQLWRISGNSAEKFRWSDAMTAFVQGLGKLVDTEHLARCFAALVYVNGAANILYVFEHGGANGTQNAGSFLQPGVISRSRGLYEFGTEIVPGFPEGGQTSCWTYDPPGGVLPEGDPFQLDMINYFGNGAMCQAEGTTYQSGELAFEFGVLLNVETGVISTCSGVNFTCAQKVAGGVSCAPEGQLPGSTYLGDRYGYIALMDPTIRTWGSPFNRFQYATNPRICTNAVLTPAGSSTGFMLRPAVGPEALEETFTVTYNGATWDVEGSVTGVLPVAATTGVYYSEDYAGGKLQFLIYNGQNAEPYVTGDEFSFDVEIYDVAFHGLQAVVQGTLAVDNDGVGCLPGLIVCKLSEDGTREFRRALSNSINTIVLENTAGGTAWTTAPTATDTYIVGPVDVLLRWQERRTKSPMSITQLEMNMQEDLSAVEGDAVQIDMPISMDLFLADGNANTLVIGQPPTHTFQYSASDLRLNRGVLYAPPKIAKASAMQLRMMGAQNSDWRMTDLIVGENLLSPEDDR